MLRSGQILRARGRLGQWSVGAGGAGSGPGVQAPAVGRTGWPRCDAEGAGGAGSGESSTGLVLGALECEMQVSIDHGRVS